MRVNCAFHVFSVRTCTVPQTDIRQKDNKFHHTNNKPLGQNYYPHYMNMKNPVTFVPFLYYLLTCIHADAFLASSKSQRLKVTSCNVAEQTRNIVEVSTMTLLEHVNLNVPSHEHILPFYFEVLACGMDPRKAANLESDAPKKTIWANCGASQFHLPYGDVAQKIPGHIGLRYNSLDGLKSRVKDSKAVKSYEVGVDPRSKREFVKLVDQYDNVFYCRVGDPINTDQRQPIIAPDETQEWGEHATTYGMVESECQGIDYVEFFCPKGSAEKIAVFYESVFDATTTCVDLGGGSKVAIIAFGKIDESGKSDQSILFKETTETIPPYDGHHIALYVGESAADFDVCYKNAEIAGVVWVNPRFSDDADTLEKARKWKQFRLKDIVDMKTGERIMELEHEVRSVEHDARL
jgi:hypothetical protein